MQTLGLSSEPRRSDGRLKSLLWPAVENAWDVDYLGQQGMWICTLVAVASLLQTAFTGNALFIGIGVLSALFYLVGGMGVRQGNWPAAAMVFALYSLDILAQAAQFQFPSIIRIAIALVLLSNLRATFLASEWRPAADDEDRPTRFNETLADKFVDQLPAKCWPVLQIPFIVLGATMLLLTLVGLGLIFANRFGLLPHK
jgi:hypothetical protein